jgi:ubiquinone/menaquinone biosynthesis C-methylase UbiE
MLSRWNFEDTKEMLSLLVGAEYGPEPESKLNEIRKDKKRVAEFISAQNNLNSSMQLLEIGSGCGFIARWIAPQVSHLSCADISESFLELARQECCELKNLSYHAIKSANLDFLKPASIDLAYAYNVFVHFNLFDIYLYFKEFKRVIKQDGKVWFDFANAEDFHGSLPKLFLENAGHYEKNPSCVSHLVQWCTPQPIFDIAGHWGFKLHEKIGGCNYIFVKVKD